MVSNTRCANGSTGASGADRTAGATTRRSSS
jgi:hypothetical protein